MSEEIKDIEEVAEVKPKRKAKPSVDILGTKVLIEQDTTTMLAIHNVAIKPFSRRTLLNLLKMLGVKYDEGIKISRLTDAYLAVFKLWEAQGGDPSKKKSSCCGS